MRIITLVRKIIQCNYLYILQPLSCPSCPSHIPHAPLMPLSCPSCPLSISNRSLPKPNRNRVAFVELISTSRKDESIMAFLSNLPNQNPCLYGLGLHSCNNYTCIIHLQTDQKLLWLYNHVIISYMRIKSHYIARSL